MPPDARPNILLVMTDQQRVDTIAALGGAFGAKTPAMDRLVNNGVSFNRAFCTSPICSASRATMMTGLMPTQTGVYANLGAPCSPLSAAQTTIGHRMQAIGYETAYHGKWHLGGTPADVGFEIVAKEGHDATTVNEACRFWRNRDWLESKRPFFQIVSLLNPHDVYFFDPDEPLSPDETPIAPPTILPTMRDSMAGKPFPPRHYQKLDWPAEHWQRYWRWYRRCVEKVDQQIGELMSELICSGYGPNTWMVFTADHADSSGEHGLPFKGPWMYDGVLRVPLVVVPPQTQFVGKGRGIGSVGARPASHRSDRLTSHVDLVPTFLDLAGAAPDASLPGRSLLPAIHGTDAGHDAVFAEWHQSGRFVSPIRTVRTATHKYNRFQGYGEELYDLTADPLEMNNLAAVTESAGTLAEMRERLRAQLERINDPFETYRATDPNGAQITP